MNEPFAGNIFADIALMEPAKADLLNLQPFYDHLSPFVRDIDPARLVFFEPVTWSDLAAKGACHVMDLGRSGWTGELAVGFTHVPGGAQFNATSVLSWHYYAPLPNFSWDGEVGTRMSAVLNSPLRSGSTLSGGWRLWPICRAAAC